MNRRRLLAMAAGTSLTATFATAATAPKNFVLHVTPKPVPVFQFTDSARQTHTLTDLTGKVVLLNVWATWCVPCRKEMPMLDHLQAAPGGRDFEVLPVSIDRKGIDAIDKFYSEVGIQHLPRYVAPAASQTLATIEVFGIPATLLVDRQGREIGRLIGPAEWDSPDMFAFLKDIITQQTETQQ